MSTFGPKRALPEPEEDTDLQHRIVAARTDTDEYIDGMSTWQQQFIAASRAAAVYRAAHARAVDQANENYKIAEKERILATIKRTVKESLIVLWLAKHEWNVNEFDYDGEYGYPLLFLKQHFPCRMYNLPGRVLIDLEGPYDDDLEGPALGATIGLPFPPGSRYIFTVWIQDVDGNDVDGDIHGDDYNLTIDATGQALDQSVHRLFSGEDVLGDAFHLFEALATRAADAYAEFIELDQAAAVP
jgi:hypothetical protein